MIGLGNQAESKSKGCDVLTLQGLLPGSLQADWRQLEQGFWCDMRHIIWKTLKTCAFSAGTWSTAALSRSKLSLDFETRNEDWLVPAAACRSTTYPLLADKAAKLVEELLPPRWLRKAGALRPTAALPRWGRSAPGHAVLLVTKRAGVPFIGLNLTSLRGTEIESVLQAICRAPCRKTSHSRYGWPRACLS